MSREIDPAKRDVQISKALSYLLRHGAVKERLNIDSAGYVKVSEILLNNRLKSHKTTLEDIERIVANNDKKRFTLSQKEDGNVYICANQGHSLKKVSNDNLILLNSKEEFPVQLIHGTTMKNLKLIKESGGLSKMNRNHIHFTSKLHNDDDGNASVSGLRSFSTVLIYLDIDELWKDSSLTNIKFYKSLNDVYLTEGDSQGFLPLKYFAKVINRKTNELIDLNNL